MTPSGIEPATFRFVAQHLTLCATAVSPARTSSKSEEKWSNGAQSHYANKNNMAFTATTSTKLTFDYRNCVKISYTEFNTYWSRNVEITCMYALTLSEKHDFHCAHFHENNVCSTTLCEELATIPNFTKTRHEF